jgi:hypothetical protein
VVAVSIEAKVAELMAVINDYATARKNVHHAAGGKTAWDGGRFQCIAPSAQL